MLLTAFNNLFLLKLLLVKVVGQMKPLMRTLPQKLAKLMERRYLRFLLPILVLFLAKLVGAIFLYNQLNMGTTATYWMNVNWDSNGQNAILKLGASQGLRWPYLFLGWDSAWYLSILAKSYAFSSQSYAFFPGLPFFGWFLDLIFQNPFYSLVIVSFLLGILWVPLYQLVAETYLEKTLAFLSTLFFAFFPYVFLFTTVTYAEGLFLLFTLGAWLLLKKGKLFFALLLAAGAAISRPSGIIIILPIFIVTLKTTKETFQKRAMFYFSIPFLSYFAWMTYCKITVGDWFAFANRSAWNSMYSFSSVIINVANGVGINDMLERLTPTFQHLPFSLVWIVFILITPFLIQALFKMEKSLAIYSLVYFLAILIGGAIGSIPRFISFVFPLWLLLTSKLFKEKHSKKLVLMICILFYLIGLFFWYSFLNGEFIA